MFRFLKEFKNKNEIKRQRAKKGYSWYDLCDIDEFFQTTFVNMIREFEENKISYPELQFEEVESFEVAWVNEQFAEIVEPIKKSKWFDNCSEEDFDEYSIKDPYIRWRLVLRRIAYCLEQTSEELCSEVNEYQEEYFDKKFGHIKCIDDLFIPNEDNPKLYKLNTKEVSKKLERKFEKRQKEIEKYKIKMKNEAFNLISKYFFNLIY